MVGKTRRRPAGEADTASCQVFPAQCQRVLEAAGKGWLLRLQYVGVTIVDLDSLRSYGE